MACCNTKNRERLVLISLFLAIASALVMSVQSAIVKQLKHIPPVQLAFYRMFCFVAFALPTFSKTETNPFGPQNARILLWLFGFLSASTAMSSFYTFQNLPLGEGRAIMATMPLFVIITARIFLHEKSGILETLLSLVIVIGSLFVTGLPEKITQQNFSYSVKRIVGLVAALVNVITHSFRFVVLRKLRTVSNSTIMLNAGIIGSVVTITAVFISNGKIDSVSCGVDGYLIIAMGFLGHTGVFLISYATKYGPAGPVSTVKSSTDVTFGFLLQMFYFGENPTLYSSVGVTVVILTLSLLGVTKWVKLLKDDSVWKQRFKWMLK